jgi:hypothetical protein
MGYYQENKQQMLVRMQRKTLIHCWWTCKFVQPLWKSVWVSQETNNRTMIWFCSTILGPIVETHTTPMFMAALFTIA